MTRRSCGETADVFRLSAALKAPPVKILHHYYLQQRIWILSLQGFSTPWAYLPFFLNFTYIYVSWLFCVMFRLWICYFNLVFSLQWNNSGYSKASCPKRGSRKQWAFSLSFLKYRSLSLSLSLTLSMREEREERLQIVPSITSLTSSSDRRPTKIVLPSKFLRFFALLVLGCQGSLEYTLLSSPSSYRLSRFRRTETPSNSTVFLTTGW